MILHIVLIPMCSSCLIGWQILVESAVWSCRKWPWTLLERRHVGKQSKPYQQLLLCGSRTAYLGKLKGEGDAWEPYCVVTKESSLYKGGQVNVTLMRQCV